MPKRGKVFVNSAKVQSTELTGRVTVGAESAARLSKVLGRPVVVGETFDLGTLAYYNKNPIKRFLGRFKIKRHVFNP